MLSIRNSHIALFLRQNKNPLQASRGDVVIQNHIGLKDPEPFHRNIQSQLVHE